jgi:lactoylglutathione lyase
MGQQINLVGLFVSDLAKQVAFYRDVLGFAIEWDGQGPYAEFRAANVRFGMYERRMLPALLGQTPSFPSGLNGTFELAIDFPTYHEVDREFERVVKGGANPVYAPRDEPWNMRSAMVADPEGNLIEIFSQNKS